MRSDGTTTQISNDNDALPLKPAAAAPSAATASQLLAPPAGADLRKGKATVRDEPRTPQAAPRAGRQQQQPDWLEIKMVPSRKVVDHTSRKRKETERAVEEC